MKLISVTNYKIISDRLFLTWWHFTIWIIDHRDDILLGSRTIKKAGMPKVILIKNGKDNNFYAKAYFKKNDNNDNLNQL